MQRLWVRISLFLISMIAMIIAVFSLSAFYVNEGEKALVQRFGRLNTGSDGKAYVYEPGLHFLVPFIEQVKLMSVKTQLLSVPSDRIYTSEQKTVTVDYYANWRVKDINLFYLRLNGGNFERARQYLRGKINDALRVEIGKREVNDVITGQRGDIIDTLKEKSAEAVESLGIEVLDVRISRVDYPQEVSESVFARMQAAREKEAGMYRSEGDEESERIRARGDADRVMILAKANQQASEIRAQGDAEAAKIFNDSYEKSTPLFDLLRSLDTYNTTIKQGETMLVDMKASKLFGPILDVDFKLN